MSNLDLKVILLTSIVLWRVCYFIVVENGPFDLMYRFRKKFSFVLLGNVFECFYCMSFWISWGVSIYMYDGASTVFFNCLLLSGVVSLLYKFSQFTEKILP
jgi:hypothetical protein